jgi:hypothetical protein
MSKWPTGPCRAFATSSGSIDIWSPPTRSNTRNGEIDILDLESIVLTGKIIERQKDRRTGEAKYVIRGVTLANAAGCVVAKFDSIGRAVIITVYVE